MILRLIPLYKDLNRTVDITPIEYNINQLKIDSSIINIYSLVDLTNNTTMNNSKIRFSNRTIKYVLNLLNNHNISVNNYDNLFINNDNFNTTIDSLNKYDGDNKDICVSKYENHYNYNKLEIFVDDNQYRNYSKFTFNYCYKFLHGKEIGVNIISNILFKLNSRRGSNFNIRTINNPLPFLKNNFKKSDYIFNGYVHTFFYSLGFSLIFFLVKRPIRESFWNSLLN